VKPARSVLTGVRRFILNGAPVFVKTETSWLPHRLSADP
jgi:hypothetical protein